MSIPDRISRYRILRKLGEGGMGVVFAARDERLDRAVALKLIARGSHDEHARARLWREARLAASVNHPNLCPVYEVGEEDGELYLAMELLEGESLASCLSRGPLDLARATGIALEVLAALEALHAHGLVHRDVKPSNVFLTPHGARLVDFGIARPVEGSPLRAGQGIPGTLTSPGEVIGTPRYMSPEQLQGRTVDARSDLFATAAMLYEIVAGRPAFEGRTPVEIFHATLYEEPPALTGSPAADAVGRVLRRALAKKPDQRPGSAAAMAEELRAALHAEDGGESPRVRSMTRLIALPLRVLRPDPETDFLAFSLPDAVASSLTGLGTLVVRGSLAAARFAGETPDLKRIAEEADVDLVLAGTLLRVGDRVRVHSQLLEAPGGTLLWTHASQLPLRDLFQLEEELVRRIVESIALPLTTREHWMLKRDVPASTIAYELFLRANQAGQGVNAVVGARTQLPIARDLYLRCLEEDPRYAPAWARLGRCYRLLAKTGEEPERNLDLAGAALERALELNPDLPMAHHLSAALDAERGRAAEAMLRLLGRAEASPHDPDLFVGLVQVCRYCGLLDASLAAHERVRRLDPRLPTSVGQTHWLRGDFARALQADSSPLHRATVLATEGREDEALRCVPELTASMQPLSVLFWTSFRAAIEGGAAEQGRAAAEQRIALVQDPEARFHTIRHLSRMGVVETALLELARVVEDGYACPEFLAGDPWLAPLRERPEFQPIASRALARRDASAARFAAAGGERILSDPSRAADLSRLPTRSIR